MSMSVILGSITGLSTRAAGENGRDHLTSAAAFSLTPGDYVGKGYGTGAPSSHVIKAELGRRKDVIAQNRAMFSSAPALDANGKPIANMLYVDETGRVRQTDSRGIRTQINEAVLDELAAKMNARREEADRLLMKAVASPEVWEILVGEDSDLGPGSYPGNVPTIAQRLGLGGALSTLKDADARYFACTIGPTGSGAGAGVGKQIEYNLKKAQLILMCSQPELMRAPIHSYRGLSEGSAVTYDYDNGVVPRVAGQAATGKPSVIVSDVNA